MTVIGECVIYVRQSLRRGKIQRVKSRIGNRRFTISPQLEHLKAYLKTWRPNALACCVQQERYSLGSRPGSQAEVSCPPKNLAFRSVFSMISGMATPRCSIKSDHRWQVGRIGLGTRRRRPRWATRTQSRQTNAELQMNLGKFCTLLHGMNK